MMWMLVNAKGGAREDLVVHHSQARRVLAYGFPTSIMASFTDQ